MQADEVGSYFRPEALGHGFFLVRDYSAPAGYALKRSYPVWLDLPGP